MSITIGNIVAWDIIEWKGLNAIYLLSFLFHSSLYQMHKLFRNWNLLPTISKWFYLYLCFSLSRRCPYEFPICESMTGRDGIFLVESWNREFAFACAEWEVVQPYPGELAPLLIDMEKRLTNELSEHRYVDIYLKLRPSQWKTLHGASWFIDFWIWIFLAQCTSHTPQLARLLLLQLT